MADAETARGRSIRKSKKQDGGNPSLETAEIERHLCRAIKHHQAGKLGPAGALYRQILRRNPRHADALHLLGVIAYQSGSCAIAADWIGEAIAIKPHFPKAYNNLGNALMAQGHWDEAVAAYRKAIALKPDYALAHGNLGGVLGKMGRLDEAVVACRQAIVLEPGHPDAYVNLGTALVERGQIDEAIAAYRQALAYKPDYAEAHSSLILAQHFHPGCDARVIASEQRRWSRRHADPLMRCNRPHPNSREPERRLRVGYVSPDFRDHAVGWQILPLLREHDRRQFHITAYASVAQPDAVTERLRACTHRWRDISAMSDEEAARQVRRDRIDILVDLALHTAGNRLLLFARKPAPIQVTFAGYPGATGLRAIDYRLTDPYLEPPELSPRDDSYFERPMHLSHSFWTYESAANDDVPINTLPALASGSVTFGCLGNFCKVNEQVLRLWSRVLRSVPGSRLLLLTPEGEARQRALAALRRHRVAASRVEFVGRQPRLDYLRTYHRIDVALDTLPYNGHVTSLDALWMGVPVVTLTGKRAVSRAGWSHVSNLGLANLACRSEEHFVQAALGLVKNLPRLSGLRTTLRERMRSSPLMDAPRFARDVEAAYRRMWQSSKWR